jgi:photosystem II stability/assembly factor-like uncharacterized protein
MKRILVFLIVLGLFLSPAMMDAKKKAASKDKPKSAMSPGTFMGLKFRSIGPAFCSGRIADFAVNPKNHSEYYVAVAAGNVWKTVNSGVTWKPIFDKYGSWSIADVEIDPNNTNVVWVGTGEYNSQRAIGYGDGVYRSEDGGKSFKNMGLKTSEHIGRIVIDPRNSHVYAAAQGPLWGPGGERGLYKSTDNGKTWNAILTVSEHTGITDLVYDPRNPDILYAASYQRRRRVFTLINGGPESAIYKSEDAGKTWNKLKSGLPGGDVGRIGLTISPVNPDVVYAIIEAAGDTGGFFRSTNRGASWKKMSKMVSGSPQYYNRIFADPRDVDKVYSLDTRTKVTLDGGKTFKPVGNKSRHVDDHAMWIDPCDTSHFLIGGDGGIYETFDSGKNWLFKSNLPVTQFYRVSLDNRKPFYYVYGGTQDNNSMGGPSQTLSQDGIVNSDWFVTNGGDGFKSQVDPENPDIIYAQSQYGGLVRYDRKSGESVYIQPQEGKGEAYRWNWNAPLIISPHSHTRLYFGANILFRSDDYGSTWKKVSGDLTRQLDRNKLKVMGKIQAPDAVAKSRSTSLFGNLVSLSESPLKEGLIYVGADDGLIQVTGDGGANWSKIDRVPGVPYMTYVSCLYTSLHDAGTVYATFDGRKNSDLKPYVFKSTDKGKTWTNITANLPGRGTVYTIAQDHVKKDLLFVGTEFGFFFSIDGGKKWTQLKGGLPVTAVRDIVTHTRENDIAIATFGRGFYILDNYLPLRELTPEILKKKNHMFAVKDAIMYIQKRAKYGQGETYFKAKNPAFGAAFSFYLKDSVKTMKQKRIAAEKKAGKKGVDIKYPTLDELRAEDNEPKPYLLFTVKDETGAVVRRLKSPAMAGLKRVNWDLKYPSPMPASLTSGRGRFGMGGGMPVVPGKYTVSVSLFAGGMSTPLEGSQTFAVKPLENTTLPAKDRKALTAFHKKAAELVRVVQGAGKVVSSLKEKIKLIKVALHNTPGASPELSKKAAALEAKIKKLDIILNGDRSIRKRNASQPPGLSSRVFTILYGLYRSTSDPTRTLEEQYSIVKEGIDGVLKKIKQLIESDVKPLEAEMEKAGAPWTPGRIPVLKD